MFMKIVLDTNVLINGLRDENSYEKRIIDAVINGEVEAYANKQTLQENKLLLNQLVDNPDYEYDLNRFFARVNHVVNRRNVHVVNDREDNKILESAVEAAADYLITSDNDLLNINQFQNVKITTPAGFWANYHDESANLWQQWTKFISGQ